MNRRTTPNRPRAHHTPATIAGILIFALCAAIFTPTTNTASAAQQPNPQSAESVTQPPPSPQSQQTPQQQTPPAQPAPITSADIAAILAAIEAQAEPYNNLDPSILQPVRDLYTQALSQARDAESRATAAAEFRREAAETPALIESIRAELNRPAEEPVIEVPTDATLAQLESLLQQANAELAAAVQQVDALRAESQRRDERRTQIPPELAQARAQLATIDEQLASAAAPRDDNDFLPRARLDMLRASRYAASQAIALLEAELANYEARREVLPARIDRRDRRRSIAERTVQRWQAVVSERRQIEAERTAREAERLRAEAARQHPVLQNFAEQTRKLAAERVGPQGLLQQLADTERLADRTRIDAAALRDQFRSTFRRVQASGLNHATGLILRRQYESLPPVNDLHRRLRLINRQIEEAEFQLIERQEERAHIGDIDRVVTNLVESIESTTGTEAAPEVRTIARELALARRDLLDQLVCDASAYFDRLADLYLVTKFKLDVAEGYREYIEERILWVRSIAGDTTPTASDIYASVQWLFAPNAWADAGQTTLRGMRDEWPRVTLLGLALIAIILLHRQSVKRLSIEAKLVGSYRTDAYKHSVAAAVMTIVIAIRTPALLWIIGHILTISPVQPEQVAAVGAGLVRAAYVMLPLSFIRAVLRRDGLADAHFRWPEAPDRLVRRHLRWFIAVVVPAAALIRALENRIDDTTNASLARLLFSVSMIALSLFIYRVFRPSGLVLTEVLKRAESPWLERLKYVWYPLLAGLPLALIAITWAGYFYTAVQLERRFEMTLALVVAIAFANAMLMRWLFIARRRVAVEGARRRREQAAAEEAASTEGSEAPAIPFDEERVDLPDLSQKARKLFGTTVLVSLVVGFFMIWADVLPALRMLDRYQIWPTLQYRDTADRETMPVVLRTAAAAAAATPPGTTTRTAPTDSGSTTTSADPIAMMGIPTATSAQPADAQQQEGMPSSVSLADLGLALIILIATIVIFRNLPALVEIVVLQQLPLDAGARYALSTVLRYIIATIGIVLAFNAISISWANIQWLAAAFTFGLAFGLQEIFANFVSGLIILGERPVRVGDTVTVNGVSGSVTKIRMRATTITDWERKEHVFPNKTFITGEIINWTLSDSVLRITINVGVSYSEDTEKVTELLRKIATEHPGILRTPAPTVLFAGFGDSTLNFELRTFLPNLENIVATRHQLHTRIIKEFRAAGIEIAFPQRDLHIRSIGDLAGVIRESRSQQPQQPPAPQ